MGCILRNLICTTSSASVLVLLLSIFAACGDDGGETATSPTAQVASPAPAASPSPAAAAVPTPDPLTLVAPGFALDEAARVSLDGSEGGQFVIVSHTVQEILITGDPSAASVPATGECTTDPSGESGPAACLFRTEVFVYDTASGWARIFATPEYPEEPPEGEKPSVCGHRCGIQGVPSLSTLRLDDGREALIVGTHYCTGVGSGCGTYHEVLSMDRAGEVSVAYTAWQASFELEGQTVVFNTPAFFRDDAGCCPSGRRVETLGLVPAGGEVGVLESRLVLCTEGRLTREPVGPDTLALSCGQDAPLPGSIYRTNDQTIVAPADISGVQGLRDGDEVLLEYRTECEGETSFCLLLATKITLVSP